MAVGFQIFSGGDNILDIADLTFRYYRSYTYTAPLTNAAPVEIVDANVTAAGFFAIAADSETGFPIVTDGKILIFPGWNGVSSTATIHVFSL